MTDNTISNAFMVFSQEAPEHAKAWGEMVGNLSKANCLDPKTTSLVYLGILGSLNLLSGIPYHVGSAKAAGATRDEIKSAILLALPAAGHKVTQALAVALESFDKA